MVTNQHFIKNMLLSKGLFVCIQSHSTFDISYHFVWHSWHYSQHVDIGFHGMYLSCYSTAIILSCNGNGIKCILIFHNVPNELIFITLNDISAAETFLILMTFIFSSKSNKMSNHITSWF